MRSYPQCQVMNTILDPIQGKGGLYLGQLEAAQNIQMLNYYNVQYVLTVSIEANPQFLNQPNIIHKVIECHDMPGFNIKSVFSQAHQFINDTLQSGNILVHCVAGLSRSVSVVVSFLMKNKSLTLEQALRFVKSKRPIVRPNPGFLRQLLDYERELYGGIISQLSYDITPYYGVQSEPNYQPNRKSQMLMPVKASSRDSVNTADTWQSNASQQKQMKAPVMVNHNCFEKFSNQLQVPCQSDQKPRIQSQNVISQNNGMSSSNLFSYKPHSQVKMNQGIQIIQRNGDQQIEKIRSSTPIVLGKQYNKSQQQIQNYFNQYQQVYGSYYNNGNQNQRYQATSPLSMKQ